jgi:hypothetical protein
MCGPVTEQVVWGVRTNQEQRQLYKTTDAGADIRRRTAKLGNTIRMDQTRVTKGTFKEKK